MFQSSIGAEMRHGAGFARIEQRLGATRDDIGTMLHLRCGLFMTNLVWISTGGAPGGSPPRANGRVAAVGRPA